MSDWTYPHIRRHPNGRDWQVVGPGDAEIMAGSIDACRKRLAELLTPRMDPRAETDGAMRRAIGNL